ncbi:MAG TPA: hypothetical protein VKU19_00545 [Bryobacteraceae bacterium]|nr:hypothetical protein [Bryobacteraceae bacterium]
MLRIPRELLAAATFLTGCGYVGNPLPPLANVPNPVTDLTAVQRNNRIIVHFKLPTTTTENVILKSPPKLDLRIGAAEDGPFRVTTWATQATAVPPGVVQNGLATYAIPASAWTGKRVVIGARVIGTNGKESNWTALEPLPVIAPPERPANLDVQGTAEGLKLTWSGDPGEFRIYRHEAESKIFAPVADVSQTTWTDKSTEFGKSYTYLVQRIVKLGLHQEAESEQSDEKTQLLVDTFPPAPPAGLRAAPAAGSVELSWDRNEEPDLAGYRVYRAVAGGDFVKIADVSQVPTYSDRTVESGKEYRYAITAFDKATPPNESGKSEAAVALVP